MKKKLLLLAALLTGLGFSATAAVGDVFTSGNYRFKVVAEGDVNEVEFTAPESGAYNVPSTSALVNITSVSNDGITYAVVGVGEYAFQNAQFVVNGNTNFPPTIRYVSDYAFTGVKSGSSESRSSIRFYGNTLRQMSDKAFIDNNLQGSILIASGDEENGFIQVKNTATSSYTTGDMWLLAERGTKFIAFPKTFPVGNSNGWAPAYKLEINEAIKTIGAYAMMNYTNYKQVLLHNVEVIETAAFKNTGLTTLTLPATITSVAADAFEGVTTLTAVTVNCSYDAVKDVVFDNVVYNRIKESGQINVPAEELETFKADPNWGRFWAPKMYIAGDFTNWQDGKLEMAEENGNYTITVNGITDGQEFKFIQDEGEDAVWYGGNSPTTPYYVHADWCTDIELISEGSVNFAIVGGGDLTFTVSADKKLTVTGWPEPANELYLAGSMTNWDTDKEAMTLDEETGKFSITKEMEAGAEFKFIDQDGAWIGGDADGNFVVNEAQVAEGVELSLLLNGGNNFEIPVAGTWTLTVDKSAMKLVISGEWLNPKYTVTVADGIENGTVEVDKAEAEEGELVTVTATPVDRSYQLKSITVTPETLNLLVEVDENGQFTMPADNVVVTAEFEPVPPVYYTVTVADGIENGTVEVDKSEAEEGELVTVTAVPVNRSYRVKSITVTPETLDLAVIVDENGQFEMPADNVTVSAEFELIPPIESEVTFTAESENGSVAVYVDNTPIESGATVAEGTVVTVVLTPAEGYKVGSFTVETVDEEPAPGLRRASVPVSEEGENTYSFEMPADPVSLNVEFTEDSSTGITDLNAAAGTVTYVNVMGQTSNVPFQGVNIVMQNGKAIGKVVK